MGQEKHKLNTVAKTNANLGSPQTRMVDPKVIKVKKAKVKKPKSLIIIGSPEEATPGQTHVQEQTIKLGGAGKRGGKEGATIGGRKFKRQRYIGSITTSPTRRRGSR